MAMLALDGPVMTRLHTYGVTGLSAPLASTSIMVGCLMTRKLVEYRMEQSKTDHDGLNITKLTI
jgi:hypothetical protein